MGVLRIEALPDAPLAAAAAFHADWLPRIEALLTGGETPLTLAFPSSDHTHRGWRLAAVQALARAHTPMRVNAIATDNEAAIGAALRYLEGAPGVTGQYLVLDGAGAGAVLGLVP